MSIDSRSLEAPMKYRPACPSCTYNTFVQDLFKAVPAGQSEVNDFKNSWRLNDKTSERIFEVTIRFDRYPKLEYPYFSRTLV